MAKVELKVQEYLSTDQEWSFRTWLYNRSGDGSTINPEEYRVIVYGIGDSKISELTVTTETGFDRSAGLGTGGLGFFTPSLLAYETVAHPPFIGSSDASRNYVFTYHMRSRFDCTSGLPTSIPDGEGVSGSRIRVRRVDSKIYSKTNNNDPLGDNIYTLSYSYEGSTSYVYNPRIILEHNSIDPSNANSTNWAPVDVYDASGTLETTQPYYPYASDINGSTHSATTTNHRTLLCDAATYVSDNLTTTNFGSETTLKVDRDWWDGSGDATNRAYMHFDDSVLPSGYTLEGMVVLPHTNTTDASGSSNLVYDIALPATVWDESTLTWDTQPSLANYEEWTMFSNTNDIRDRSFSIRIGTKLQDFLDYGVVMKHSTETGTQARFTMYSNDASSDQPLMFVRFSGGTPPSSNEVRLHVW